MRSADPLPFAIPCGIYEKYILSQNVFVFPPHSNDICFFFLTGQNMSADTLPKCDKARGGGIYGRDVKRLAVVDFGLFCLCIKF